MDKVLERLDKVLKERNMSKYRLSELTGLTSSFFSNWKRGHFTPKIDKLRLIEEALGLPESYLLVDSVEHEKELLQQAIDEQIANSKLAKSALAAFVNLPKKLQEEYIKRMRFDAMLYATEYARGIEDCEKTYHEMYDFETMEEYENRTKDTSD